MRRLDIDDIARTMRRLATEGRGFAAIEDLSRIAFDHALLTAMLFRVPSRDAVRIHSSRPDLYPVGGVKAKAEAPASYNTVQIVHKDGTGVGFADAQLLTSLDVTSVMRVPVGLAGQFLGTLNISSSGWPFGREDGEVALILAGLAAPLFLEAQADLPA
jgi:GAF domain-containing protein